MQLERRYLHHNEAPSTPNHGTPRNMSNAPWQQQHPGPPQAISSAHRPLSPREKQLQEQRDSTYDQEYPGLGANSGWDNQSGTDHRSTSSGGTGGSGNIWGAPQQPSKENIPEVSSPVPRASPSFSPSHASSSPHLRGNQHYEADMVSAMSGLNFQGVTSKPTLSSSVSLASGASGNTSIPGLIGLSSASNMDNSIDPTTATQSSIQAAAQLRRSPINLQRRESDDSSSRQSGSAGRNSRRRRGRRGKQSHSYPQQQQNSSPEGDMPGPPPLQLRSSGDTESSSEALRALMGSPTMASRQNSGADILLSDLASRQSSRGGTSLSSAETHPILPQQMAAEDYGEDDEDASWDQGGLTHGSSLASSQKSKRREWLLRMNRRLQETPVGELDPTVVPLNAVMNGWAKTKSSQGAAMVEMWLNRSQQEFDAGNSRVMPTAKMYTMAVDAWAKSGEGGAAARRAEAILQHMNQLYQSGGHDNLKPTTGIFNAVINAWARSREKIAPVRAEQILEWMEKLHDNENLDIQPDKYTFNTVIHAWAKSGGKEAAVKAQQLLNQMHKMHQEGNLLARPDTITYNVVINAWAKSMSRGAAMEAEKLLTKMHRLHESGEKHVMPNVVTYGAVIDAYAKSGEKGAAARADTLLASMIQLHQSDPISNKDLAPNTYVFNTVINCWAKSKEPDAASKAEEMLVAMGQLGIPTLKPDAFTYTAVIDAWAKSGHRGAASRADQLLDKMEAKYMAGDADLKPNTFTYNAVINALAKSGEPGAAARAERVLQNMVNRHRTNSNNDIKPTTINFNTVLDAWAKSGGGRASAERAEEILEWMDRLYKGGNKDVRPDTITFNAVLDAWARSGDRMAPHRAEQIVNHMDELYRAGNKGVKPDTYTYNTLINAWAKSGEKGSAARAEHVLSVMERRYADGDQDFKPNTRTHTSVIDAWAKSGEKGAARRAEQILNAMQGLFESSGDSDVKPNVHTANAVCNACAFTKIADDRIEALQIAFRVYDWLLAQPDMDPDAYTYTILLSVCANLLPKEDTAGRYSHAKAFFERCCEAGHVNDYVLRKLRATVSEEEYLTLVNYQANASAAAMPPAWTRNARGNSHSSRGRKSSCHWSNRRGSNAKNRK